MSNKKKLAKKSAIPHHQNDELADIREFQEKYGKQTLTLLLVLAIGFSGYQFIKTHKQHNIAEASAKLGSAKSIPDLEAIVANYSKTKSAQMALISLAKQYFDKSNYEVAFTKYEDFIRDYPKSRLIDTAKLGRIFCIEARRNDAAMQEAAKAYAKFSKENPDSFLTPQAIFGQARCLEQLGKLEKARIIYEDFIANKTNSPWLPIAEDNLKQLTRKIANKSTNNNAPVKANPVSVAPVNGDEG